ncbi:MAG: CDP-glycerol: N-acetyl-beta-D-mannosaminyl-1,4-N-acetyl-D-glucosaminyldiphosphoundecaprenyl glycerophosphotransferase [uncultured Campylobacterales bacterium]|uniref:CDP-glycerol: N-acetyl-beta-D-mannosaminyl-1,4-N-acetyl-D-glucosaminyldip hosphoundecaprenyl glycerophosphotransferase n=1 Tax=uncultured Campylobacterales bacterium TaxID=352960 RepID=A0A6S6SJS3_9BACT|nr:MAG: CDP-glycerol: N-acetyl-beta-D-mannosaminyl-1,4-N-acetyl-D-glucosaminyldiphosphoundecaprenyl glycerophosphotransferase [uncultured Campylobacterales bacterium]
MKFVLFCNLPYAFGILRPLELELKKHGFEYIWYLPKEIEKLFKYENYTTNIKDIRDFKSDVIFVPGNEVPYYLRGLKVQIFHGLAGEKKGHFRIRDYFDLYLTQGPYFTKRFEELSQIHKNFEVIQTGWPKLDNLFVDDAQEKRKEILNKHNVKNIVLYSPTFSRSLHSANEMYDEIQKFGKETLIIIKFHDKMDEEIKARYENLKSKNILISQEKDITKLLKISDLMISDTSSVVYEFALLNKPVVTINSTSPNIVWEDLKDAKEIVPKVHQILDGDDKFKEKRKKLYDEYHPYDDSNSALRMIDAVVKYLDTREVPTKRKISLLRKLKILKIYKDS